jgi:hypothetical protein
MKFTIALSDLENLLKTLASRPKATDTFTLSACAARVFVECKGDIGGIEALVFEDGAVSLPTKKFRELLKTYKGRQSLTIEAAEDGLRIGNFQMCVLDYTESPKAPGKFQVFGATVSPDLRDLSTRD